MSKGRQLSIFQHAMSLGKLYRNYCRNTYVLSVGTTSQSVHTPSPLSVETEQSLEIVMSSHGLSHAEPSEIQKTPALGGHAAIICCAKRYSYGHAHVDGKNVSFHDIIIQNW